MKRIASLVVLATLLLTLPARSFAQDSQSLTDDEAVKIARAYQELDLRRAEVAALKETLGAKDRQVAALESALEAAERAAAKWKEAVAERRDANALDGALQKSYEESVTRYKEELERVREERDSARRSRWTIGALAFGLGAVLAVLATRD